VARREDETVAVRPGGVGRVVAQEASPQHVGRRGRAHRQAGMAGVRLLHGVDRQEADGIDGSLVEALCRHGRLL
jgi:hypothetical protein